MRFAATMLIALMVCARITTCAIAEEKTSPAASGEMAKPAAPNMRPRIIDHADVTPPVKSFQYWLDTIQWTDDQLEKNAGLVAPVNETKEARVKRLYAERSRRLEASFDFEAFFDNEDKRMGKMSSPEVRALRKADLIRYYLGSVAHDKFAQRNIKAVESGEHPDWEKGSAWIYLELKDIVTEQTLRYKMHMRLYPDGLCWRWYDSENVPIEQTTREIKPGEDATAKQMAAVDEQIKAMKDKLAKVDGTISKERNAHDDLREQLAKLESQRAELERVRNPYGTPEMAYLSTHKALYDGNWENFLASHTKRARDAAGQAARDRFDTTRKNKEVKGTRVLGKTVDPQSDDRVTIKVEMTFAYKSKLVYEDGEWVERKEEEKRIEQLKMVREGGKWLMDEDM